PLGRSRPRGEIPAAERGRAPRGTLVPGGVVSGASSLLGVVVVPEGFDANVELLGLTLLVRHALALQSAGCDALAVVGAARLSADARLRLPVHHELVPHARALVVRADVTSHRSVPPRVAAEARLAHGEVVRAGSDEAGIYATSASRTEEVAQALASSGRARFDRELPLLGGVSAEFVVPADTS